MIRTTPFANSIVRMRDGEGMAFVPVNDTLWLADDNAEMLYEVNRASGFPLSTIGLSELAQAVQLGGTEVAGIDRATDIEGVALDPVNDVLYVLSGNCCPASPAAFRLVRDSVTGKFRVETFQPLDPTADFSGAAWHPTEQRLYVSQTSQVKPYDCATNTIGAPVPKDSRILGAIVGLGFSPDGNDLWLVTTAALLYRVSWATKQIVEGHVFDLRAHGIADPRAVEIIDGQLYVLDGFALPDTDPRRFAVTVFNLVAAPFTASITTPAAGATVSGTTTVDMVSTGGAAGTRTFRLDLIAGTTTTLLTLQAVSATSLSFSWNTLSTPNGPATLRLTVTASDGTAVSTTRNVTVSNGTTTPTFTASIAHPAEGAVVRGSQTVGLSTTAPWGQSKTFVVSVDGQVIINQTTTGTTVWTAWDSRTTPDGSRTLTLAVTFNGATATATRNVTVSNGTTTAAVTASITAPSAGATVNGTTSVTMASGGGATGPRTFRLDLVAGTTTTMLTQQSTSGSTSSFAWVTTGSPNGPATLRLIVTDAAGATATATRDVTISNGATPALTAAITSPAAGATVSGTTAVNMTSSGGATGSRTMRLEAIAGTTTTLLTQQTVSGTSLAFAWNTTPTPNGPATLRLTVTDAAGATAAVTRDVTVSNGATTPTFTATITYPAEGAIVRGIQGAGLSTTAPWGRSKTFVVAVDGQVIVNQVTTGTTLWVSWDSRTTPDGPRALTLGVTFNGATATATRNVTLSNGATTPPGLTASISSPSAGAAVAGTTNVTMASGGGATGSRTFRLDVIAGTTTVLTQQTVTGGSLTVAWDTTSMPNGPATLRLTVTDSAGATATVNRDVTVANGTTPTSTFSASITYPAAGAVVRGSQTVGMSTTAPWGQSKTFVLSVDGQVIVSHTTTGTTLWIAWDSRTTPSGARTLTLTVTFNGATATAARNVTVGN